MHRLTASEARRRWLQILDRVAAGEPILIEHKGRGILLRREDDAEIARDVPDYSAIIRPIDDMGQADEWGWEWDEAGGLRPRSAADE